MSAPTTNYAEWAGVAVAAFTAGAGIVGAVGKLLISQLEKSLKMHTTKQVADSEGRLEQKMEVNMHSFGESVHAARAYTAQTAADVAKLELKTEREFLRKDDFVEFKNEHRTDMKDIRVSLDELLRRNST